MPQLEDGYTRIANEILEALCEINLSGREFRAVLALIRLTYGWQKKEDQISYSQFAELTGIARNHVQEIFKGLAARKIVVKIKAAKKGVPENGNSEPLIWRFQKDYTRWRKRKGGVPKTGNSSRKQEQKCSRKREPPKKGKESIATSIEVSISDQDPEQLVLEPSELGTPESDHKRFISWYCAMFKQKCKNKYRFTTTKDGAIIKRLLKEYPVEKLVEFGRTFFTVYDDWTAKAGFSIVIFESQINKLAGGQYGKSRSGATRASRQSEPDLGKYDGK